MTTPIVLFPCYKQLPMTRGSLYSRDEKSKKRVNFDIHYSLSEIAHLVHFYIGSLRTSVTKIRGSLIKRESNARRLVKSKSVRQYGISSLVIPIDLFLCYKQLPPDTWGSLHPVKEKSNAVGNFDIHHCLSELAKFVHFYIGPLRTSVVMEIPNKARAGCMTTHQVKKC